MLSLMIHFNWIFVHHAPGFCFLYGYPIVPASFVEETFLLVMLFKITLSPGAPRLEGVAVTNGLHLLISNLFRFPSFLLKDIHNRQASDQHETRVTTLSRRNSSQKQKTWHLVSWLGETVDKHKLSLGTFPVRRTDPGSLPPAPRWKPPLHLDGDFALPPSHPQPVCLLIKEPLYMGTCQGRLPKNSADATLTTTYWGLNKLQVLR